MCLGIPATIISVDGELALADFGGVRREISIALLPEARPGDLVMVHAGYAISPVRGEEASEVPDSLPQGAADLP